MIVVRRANQRRHQRRGEEECWLTFGDDADRAALGPAWNSLQLFNESRLPPGQGQTPHPHRNAEIITYVVEGRLAYDDSTGRSGVLAAGEFRCMTAGRGVTCSETNASRTDWVRVFQIWLCSDEAGRQPGHEQRRFSAAERRGRLRLVASPDAQLGSLRLREDARVYSALLERGHHIAHALAPRRAAWMHVVSGQVVLSDTALFAGDGAGFSGERPVSFTAREQTEVLLLDLLDGSARGSGRRGDGAC